MKAPIIESKLVQPYQLRAYCPECGEELRITMMLPANPPQWRHECERCDYFMNSVEQYPSIKFEVISE